MLAASSSCRKRRCQAVGHMGVIGPMLETITGKLVKGLTFRATIFMVMVQRVPY